jgi:hypothetical protein
VKTNIISFNGYAGCGKSTYIDKLKQMLEGAGYTVGVAHSDNTESMQQWEERVCSEYEQDAPRFLLIHHVGQHANLPGMEIAFIHRDGAMDLWAALHCCADPEEVGKEVAK